MTSIKPNDDLTFFDKLASCRYGACKGLKVTLLNYCQILNLQNIIVQFGQLTKRANLKTQFWLFLNENKILFRKKQCEDILKPKSDCNFYCPTTSFIIRAPGHHKLRIHVCVCVSNMEGLNNESDRFKIRPLTNKKSKMKRFDFVARGALVAGQKNCRRF